MSDETTVTVETPAPESAGETAAAQTERAEASAESVAEVAAATIALAEVKAAQTVAEAEGDIAALENELDEQEDDIEWLKRELSGLNASVSALQTSQVQTTAILESLAALLAKSPSLSPATSEEPEAVVIVPASLEAPSENTPAAPEPARKRRLI